MHYIDSLTGTTYPLSTPLWRSENGNYLNLAPTDGLRRNEIDTSIASVWRYAKALLVDPANAVTLEEGMTPLIKGEWNGAKTFFKMEFTMPTGSFKDRGMTLLISYLKSKGIDYVLEDSSGNAGASLSAYAAAAGMRCRILVPETASYPKIAQIAAYGAEVVTIKGSRQDVADEAIRQSEEIFYASHNWQPFFIEGTKTLAYELWEQLGFRAPDNIIIPLGYGSNILGCDRGFSELLCNGEIEKLPRLFGIQAENCAPYFNAYLANSNQLVDSVITPTIAEGIASSKPTRIKEVLNAVRTSNGEIITVSETGILEALRLLAHKGLFVEPTSATAAAGLEHLIRDGKIQKDETTIVILTGSGLKAAERIGQLLDLHTVTLS